MISWTQSYSSFRQYEGVFVLIGPCVTLSQALMSPSRILMTGVNGNGEEPTQIQSDNHHLWTWCDGRLAGRLGNCCWFGSVALRPKQHSANPRASPHQ